MQTLRWKHNPASDLKQQQKKVKKKTSYTGSHANTLEDHKYSGTYEITENYLELEKKVTISIYSTEV